MAFTSGANSNVVRTFLDAIAMRQWNKDPMPNTATPYDEMIAHQKTATNAGVNTEIFSDGGSWEVTAETADYKESTPLSGNDKYRKVVKWTQSLNISEEMLADGQFDIVQKQVEGMMRKGKRTQYDNLFGLYRGAFTTTLANNGTALISASQSNLNGDTIDNTVSGALTEATLNDAIVKLSEQKDQKGEVAGHMPQTLLVPSKLFKTACEIVDSELRSATADNDANVYSSKYNLYVKTSPLLGASAGGSDTAWFLLAQDHPVYRYVRQDITTNYVEPKYSTNGLGRYIGMFREVLFADTYEGIVGSTGV